MVELSNSTKEGTCRVFRIWLLVFVLLLNKSLVSGAVVGDGKSTRREGSFDKKGQNLNALDDFFATVSQNSTCRSNDDCGRDEYCSGMSSGVCSNCVVDICDEKYCETSSNCWNGCCPGFCNQINIPCENGYYCYDNTCLICPSSCGSWQGSCPVGCPRTEALSLGNIGFFSVALVLVICSCCFCIVNTVRRIYHRQQLSQYQELLLNQPLIDDDDGDITEGPWDCLHCDYHNTLPTRTCDMCGEPRHSEKASLELASSKTTSPFSPKSGEKRKFPFNRRSVWSWKVTDEHSYRWYRRVSYGNANDNVADEDNENGEAPVVVESKDGCEYEGVALSVSPTTCMENNSSRKDADASSSPHVVVEVDDASKIASSNSSSSGGVTTIRSSSKDEGDSVDDDEEEEDASLQGWLWSAKRHRRSRREYYRLRWADAIEACAFSPLRVSPLSRDDSDDDENILPSKVESDTYSVELADVAEAYALPVSRKIQWFRRQLTKMRIPWHDGHVKVEVRREAVLSDALVFFDKVCDRAGSDPILTSRDMHKIFRFEFVGEPAVDAGGVAREFFELAVKALFDPNFALFRQSDTSARTYWFNEDSNIAHPGGEDLHYLRFAGRVLGKALFDGHTTGAYLSRALLKHLLRAPLGVSDLCFVDINLWDMAQWLRSASDDDLESVMLDFTVTKIRFGGKPVDIELKPGGCDTSVTRQNVTEFLRLRSRYALMDSVSPQLLAFMSGFYDVIPPQLLMVFRAQELELLLCGLPTIDVKDWRAYTEYRGKFNAKHKVVQWFWEFVEELSQEMQARLLQFITGTSRVPVSGFRCLISHDGKMQQFTMQSTKVKLPRAQRRLRRRQQKTRRGFFGFGKNRSSVEKRGNDEKGGGDADRFCSYLLMPKAHTCFNRLDIPLYVSKEELRTHFILALSDTESVTGFGLD